MNKYSIAKVIIAGTIIACIPMLFIFLSERRQGLTSLEAQCHSMGGQVYQEQNDYGMTWSCVKEFKKER